MKKHGLEGEVRGIYGINKLREQLGGFGLRLGSAELGEIYEKTISDMAGALRDYVYRIEGLERSLAGIEKGFDSYLKEIDKRGLKSSNFVAGRYSEDIAEAKQKVRDFKLRYFQLDGIDLEKRLKEMMFSYRYLVASIAPLVSRLEWQSVGFNASGFPEVYHKKEFKYKGSLGYKRVHYPELDKYQDWFLSEYVDAKDKSELTCLLTNSGQGAFISIWEAISRFLLASGDKILLSAYSYFETRWIIDQSKGFVIGHFEELDRTAIFAKIKEERPKFVLIEPVYYSDGEIRLLDLEGLLRDINSLELADELYLMLDASALGGAVHPFELVDNPKVHIFLFESLIKYRQCGLDQVNSGYIAASKRFRGKLIAARASTGAIFDYLNFGYLQRIRRADYESRMRCITRNAEYIGNYLNDMENKPKMFKGIEFPACRTHRDKPICTAYPFINGVFQMVLDNDYYSNFATKLAFIDHLVANAKEAGISVNHGTSFGFQNTRLSVADTGGGEFADHHIRVSVGAESMKDTVILSRVFERSIGEFFNN